MKSEQAYRALLTVFAFVGACAFAMTAQRLAADLQPFWIACCTSLWMRVVGPAAAWPTIFARNGGLALILVASGILFRRLWKTYHFVASLESAAISKPPARLSRLLAALKLSAQVRVIKTNVPLAFCFGLLRPRICLSTGLADALSDEEIKAVLLHEDYHRRNCHPLRSLLIETLGAVLFFLPVGPELRDLLLTTAELEADRHAARTVGKPALAGALHKLLTHPLAVRLPRATGVTGLSATEARIAALLGDSPATPRLSSHSLITSSLIITLICLLM